MEPAEAEVRGRVADMRAVALGWERRVDMTSRNSWEHAQDENKRT